MNPPTTVVGESGPRWAAVTMASKLGADDDNSLALQGRPCARGELVVLGVSRIVRESAERPGLAR